MLQQYQNIVDYYNLLILNELRGQGIGQGIECWVAGGSIKNRILGVRPTDHDLFFPNQQEFDKALTWFTVHDAQVLWSSDNGMKVKYKEQTYDLVKKFFPTPTDTINEFDFTVAMFAVDGKELYHGETSFIDLAKKQLMINKLPYPASTFNRILRYYEKGFRMCSEQKMYVVQAIREEGVQLDIQRGLKLAMGGGAEVTDEDKISSGEFFSGID